MSHEPFDTSLQSEERSAELTRLLGHARADVPSGKEWEALAGSVSSIWSTPFGDPASGDAVSHDPGDLGSTDLGSTGLSSTGLGPAPVAVTKPLVFTSGVFKAVGAVALAGAVATGGWQLSRTVKSAQNSVAVHASDPSLPPPEQVFVPAPSVAPEGHPVSPPVVAAEPGEAPRTEPVRSPSSGRKLAPPPNELRLLQQAREELGKNPKQTLALCRKHEQLFPSGQLAQEREVLAIEALRRLQRDEEAEQKTQRFGKAFPDSPHQSRVKRSEP